MKNLLAVICFVASLTTIAQAPITSIPFELYGDHIVIKVTVDNSKPLDFIFDTGSGFTVLDDGIANEMKLVKSEVAMNEAKGVWHLIKHNTLEINGFLMEKNIKVYSTDFTHLEMSLGRDIDGIVGYDLLHHHGIYINYDTEVINIYDHGKVPTRGDEVDFFLDTTIPTIKGNVVLNNNEPHAGTFYVITGAGTTLDFNTPYAEQFDVIHKTGKHYTYNVKGISEVETPHYEGHVISFSFGAQKIEDLPIGITTAQSGIQASKKVSGIMGSQLLRKFNIAIDLQSKKMYFQKNSSFDEKLNVNCSGLDLQMSRDMQKLLVHQVIENSPASDAGIKVDDEVISLNGTSVKEMDFPDIVKKLKQKGEQVSLVLSRGGAEKTYDLSLRSLIE